MLVKFFRRGKENAHNAKNYLMKHGKVVRGDMNLTVEIANSIDRKWKYTSGVLSFEEKEISEKTKQEIMMDFEKTMFPDMSTDQYNIVWVEHCDKDRVELHFLSPRIELETQLEYTHYVDKIHREKMNLWRDLQNAKYSFSSPMQTSKRELTERQNIRYEKDLHRKTKKEINEAVEYQVLRGLISNRDEVVSFLQNSGFQINRQGKDYITVVSENEKKIRLKGLIYGESFTATTELEATARADEQRHIEDTRRNSEEARKKLDRILEREASRNRKKYLLPGTYSDKRDNRDHRSEHDRHIQKHTDHIIDIRGADSIATVHHSIFQHERRNRIRQRHEKNSNNTVDPEKGIEDDRTRNATARITRATEHRKRAREERMSRSARNASESPRIDRKSVERYSYRREEKRRYRRNRELTDHIATWLQEFREQFQRKFQELSGYLTQFIETIREIREYQIAYQKLHAELHDQEKDSDLEFSPLTYKQK